MSRRASLVALGWWACCGCTETTPTQVIVQLYVEPGLAVSATHLSVSVENDDGVLVLEKEKELDGSSGRIARIPLIPKGDNPARRFIVRAELLEGVSVIGRIEARAGYREDELRALNLWFSASCQTKTDCGDGRTCDRGTCRGACYETSPADATEPSEPSCKECEKCLARCEPTDGEPCGCPGDTCDKSDCIPERRVLHAAAGETHTCAVVGIDQVYCWGTSDGLGAGWSSPAPVPIPNIAGSEGIALSYHGCAIASSDRYCWGANTFGQLGDGTTVSTQAPVSIPNSQNLTELDAGFNHSCGRSVNGDVYCWGRNQHGQLGNNVHNTEDTATPEPQPVGSGYELLSANGDHTCALESGGTLRCWGSNYAGQVGVQDRTAIPTPARPGCDDPSSPRCFDKWKYVGLAGWVTCAIHENGSMYCWGSNGYGARGDGSTAAINNETAEPQPVAGNIQWSSVEGGKRHVCGLDLDDALYCWGSNELGQLGVSNRENATTPERVDAPIGWTALALGHLHTCAIRLDRTLWCWGSNAQGQVGINSTEAVVEHPTRVCF